MKILLSIVFLIITMSTHVIYDFDASGDLSRWAVVNDSVMGGVSDGTLKINEEGHGVFKGRISLDNNGGFSSVRYRFDRKETVEYTQFLIRLRGDGKRYQLRVKADAEDYYSYVTYFETSDEWQDITIPFEKMYPTFRGRKLNGSNFPGDQMEEIGFLFGNKKEEDFKLLIDRIDIK